MSAETIAIVISAVGLLLGFVGVIGWAVRHMQAQSDRSEQRLGARINQLDVKLSGRIDGVEKRIDGVERELVEVKIGLARLEGPPRGILSAR